MWQANVFEGALNDKETIEGIKSPLLKQKRQETRPKNRSHIAIINLLKKYLTIEIKYTLLVSLPVAEKTSLLTESPNVRGLWLLESHTRRVGVCTLSPWLILLYHVSSVIMCSA